MSNADEARPIQGEVSCTWTLDPDGELWDTGCGQAFCLSDGTPKENDMIYCPFCGNRISG